MEFRLVHPHAFHPRPGERCEFASVTGARIPCKVVRILPMGGREPTYVLRVTGRKRVRPYRTGEEIETSASWIRAPKRTKTRGSR